jgi:hypothetical protein
MINAIKRNMDKINNRLMLRINDPDKVRVAGEAEDK